jgi:2-methylcitrate dehydratase
MNTHQSNDSVQDKLAQYAHGLRFEDISSAALRAAKLRVIDTLGALVGGFFDESSRIARGIAARTPVNDGATVIGTRMRTTADLAAFVNATTSRCVELNDTYHGPASHGGHPSDVIAPVLAAAEASRASGREFITAVIVAYEVYLRISDALPRRTGFDPTTFAGIGVAAGAGRVMGLSKEQLAQCISIAVTPNNALNQARTGHLSMWKAVAAGQAGRAGVFAALLAADGMEGPFQPFEGKAGWIVNVAKQPFALGEMGGAGTTFKIEETLMKKRAACATSVSTILAAEKIAPLPDLAAVHRIKVETYERSRLICGSEPHHWAPQSRETADHSIPYGVAAALVEGTVSPSSYDDTHLRDDRIRGLMARIEVVENPEFSAAYDQHPVIHRSRVTVTLRNGERQVGEAGGDPEDLSTPMSDEQVELKFRRLTENVLGARRVTTILEHLRSIENVDDVGKVAEAFTFI